jgi:hypothetical protein
LYSPISSSGHTFPKLVSHNYDKGYRSRTIHSNLNSAAFLAIWQGRSAWFNGTILVLGESAAVVALLFEAFFVDETQVDIFDAVLVHKGYEDLVATSRPVAPDEEGFLDPVQRLGRPTRSAIYAPFSLRQIVEFVVFLPLTFVPYLGVPLFL